MANSRLRKTFKFPSDDETSTHSRDELDEEEQENLITDLQSRSQTSNALYTLVFTVLPLSLTPLFFYHLILSASTPARIRILCLLSLTSLTSSSFIMFFLSSIEGINRDARARLDRRQQQLARRTFTTSTTSETEGLLARVELAARKLLDRLDDVKLDLDPEGPLLKALPWLNGLMAGLLLLTAWLLRSQTLKGAPPYMWLYFTFPGVMFGMTMLARSSIMEEEKGLRELRGMKYGYKGA